jgi:hypothetical protein
MRTLLEEGLKQGFKHFKLKVGGDVATDQERLAIAREVIGYDKENLLMVDANQVGAKYLIGVGGRENKTNTFRQQCRSGRSRKRSHT